MKLYKNIFILALFMCFVFIAPAFADDGEGDVFKAIVEKAAHVLIAARNICFVIAGFGLIMFSFSAMFNKISWKHFFNIAIGLFLLSAMGAFISFFVTKNGEDYQLKYGDSLRELFSDTQGSGNTVTDNGTDGLGEPPADPDGDGSITRDELAAMGASASDIDRVLELQSKTNKTAAEQAELNNILDQIYSGA